MFRNENWKNGFVTSHFSRATIVSPAEAGPTRIGNGKRTWISRLSRLKISSAVSGSIEKSAGSKVKGKSVPAWPSSNNYAALWLSNEYVCISLDRDCYRAHKTVFIFSSFLSLLIHLLVRKNNRGYLVLKQLRANKLFCSCLSKCEFVLMLNGNFEIFLKRSL